MTRESIRAEQDDTPPTTPVLTKVTITAVNDQTVTIALPGGASTLGPRISGVNYTVGGIAYTYLQEPAIGPVIPVGSTAPISTDGVNQITTANGATLAESYFQALTRTGLNVVLTLRVRLQSGLQQNNTIVNIPDGYRPGQIVYPMAAMFYQGGFTGYAICAVDSAGTVKVQTAFGSSGNGVDLCFDACWRAYN